MCLLEEFLRKAVAELEAAELEVTTILNEVAGGAAFVTYVRSGEGGDRAAGVAECPGIHHTRTLVRTWVGEAEEVGLELLSVVNVLSVNTLPEHSEVEALVAKLNVETVAEVGHWVEDPCLVVAVDDAVAIEVGILEAAEAGILLTAGEHFLARLEQAINYITYD